jgi:hypothetical protein
MRSIIREGERFALVVLFGGARLRRDRRDNKFELAVPAPRAGYFSLLV